MAKIQMSLPCLNWLSGLIGEEKLEEHDVFITKIHIDKVRHLENIDIELSNAERKHHSPFVISSLRDAVVYDLENKERLENPDLYRNDPELSVIFTHSR